MAYNRLEGMEEYDPPIYDHPVVLSDEEREKRIKEIIEETREYVKKSRNNDARKE